MKLGAIYLRDTCVVAQVWDASSVWERTRGLLGRPALLPGQGMLIRDCRLVHTLGMRYALDLAFLDGTGQIKKLVRDIRPNRMAGSFKAAQTLELATGTLAQLALSTGDMLTWREVKP